MLHLLKTGRLIETVIRDTEGNPRFLEIFDTRTNARRIAYGPFWDGRDKSQTDGYAVSEDELPDLVEFFLEDEQSYWRRINPSSPDLIMLPGAFTYCTPKVGDTLVDENAIVYKVLHVPRGLGDLPWNLVLLLDRVPPDGATLRWAGTARDHCLLSFHSDMGKPSSPTPGEDVPDSDTGTAYRSVLQPTITYFLTRQESATISPKPFGRDKELKARVRDTFRDPERPQVTIEILGHRFDSLFRFRCLHPRAAVAGGLALWFKRFFTNNTPSLESNGVNKILFHELAQVSRMEIGGTHVVGFDVTFFIRTEELVLREYATLRKLDFNLGAALAGRPNAAQIQTVQPDGSAAGDPFTSNWDQSGNYLWGKLDIADFATTGNPIS